MDWFVVDDITGIVRIAPSNLLEWDQESTSLTLSVLAVDQGQPHPATATATLNIQIDDVDDRSPRFTKEMFIHHVAEVTPPETIILTLQAHDPLTGLLISHFELVKEPKPIVPFVSDPQAEALTSLFEDIRIDSLQPDQINSTAEDPNEVLSFIELNRLTGEISFRRRGDYEELTNKVTASIQQTNQRLSNIHVTLQTLQFQVQAIAGDLGSLRVSQATVQLEIIDTNDNSPQFNQAVRAFKNRLF